MITEKQLAKFKKKGIGPTGLMAHHQFQDLCSTLEAALRVVKEAQQFVDHNSVAHPQFTRALVEALEPFRIEEARKEYRWTGGVPFDAASEG